MEVLYQIRGKIKIRKKASKRLRREKFKKRTELKNLYQIRGETDAGKKRDKRIRELFTKKKQYADEAQGKM